MKIPVEFGSMTFYREWLPLDKKEFRILAMLADKGEYSGNLTEMCEYFSLDPQTKHRSHIRNSIQKLTEAGFIDCTKRGQTYTLKAIPKEKRIEISRRWAELVIQHKYTSESVAWEVVLKVLIWIADKHAPIITNDEIADELHISVSTIVSAKNVLEKDIGAIIKEIDKITLADGSKRNKGQRLATIADWSEQKNRYFFLNVIFIYYIWEKVSVFIWVDKIIQILLIFIFYRMTYAVKLPSQKLLRHSAAQRWRKFQQRFLVRRDNNELYKLREKKRLGA